MAKKGTADQKKALPDIRNAKARHDYFIEDTYEAGIVLTGTEVKSIRDAKCQITQAFARVEKKASRCTMRTSRNMRLETFTTTSPLVHVDYC